MQVYFVDTELGEAGAEAVAGLRAYRERHRLRWDITVLNSTVAAGDQSTEAWRLVRNHRTLRELLEPKGKDQDSNSSSSKSWPKPRPRDLVLAPMNPIRKLQTACQFNEASFGQLAAKHLQARGYRHAVLLPTPRDNRLAERQAGFQAYADRHQLSYACYQRRVDFPTIAQAEQAMARWLQQQPRPFAIFCPNDDTADWHRNWLPQQGLRVPEDVALLGCGDQLICQQCQPELSSVAYPWRYMGETAGRYIHLASQGGQPAPPMLQALRVHERGTTQHISAQDPLVRKGLRWLASHLKSSQPTQELSQFLGKSTTLINTKFRTDRQSTPKQEHDRLRIERICALLEGNDDSLDVIARKCGFDGTTPMGVAFKRRLGCTPTTWRRLYGR